jgi:hypothetical protein
MDVVITNTALPHSYPSRTVPARDPVYAEYDERY